MLDDRCGASVRPAASHASRICANARGHVRRGRRPSSTRRRRRRPSARRVRSPSGPSRPRSPASTRPAPAAGPTGSAPSNGGSPAQIAPHARHLLVHPLPAARRTSRRWRGSRARDRRRPTPTVSRPSDSTSTDASDLATATSSCAGRITIVVQSRTRSVSAADGGEVDGPVVAGVRDPLGHREARPRTGVDLAAPRRGSRPASAAASSAASSKAPSARRVRSRAVLCLGRVLP